MIRSDEGSESVDEPKTMVTQAPTAPPSSVKVQPFGGNLDPKTTPFGGGPLPPLSPASASAQSSARANANAHAEPASAGNNSVDSELPDVDGRGKVLVVFGCRGGAGATMLSVNVAAALAKGGKNVCVLDLDLQLGDVFVALDLEPNTSLSALARDASGPPIDGPLLKRRLQRHDSGLYALSQTGRLDDVDPELAERMPALLGLLTKHFDYVIIDGVRDFGEEALAVMDLADRIALILTQDVQAVRRAARVTQLFRKLGYPDKKVQVVLNRHSSRSPVAESEIERVLGLKVTATVRNDYPRLRQALDEGTLLADVARGSGVHRDVEAVAQVMFADAPIDKPASGGGEDDEEKLGFFARLFRRKK